MEQKIRRRTWLRYVGLIALVVLFVIDLHSTVAHNSTKGYQLFYKVSEVQRPAPWDRTTVAVVRTNTEGIPDPVDPDKLGF